MIEAPSPLLSRFGLYGMTVASEIDLPTARPLDGAGSDPADVTIHQGDVPDRLDRPTHRGATWMADRRSFLLDLQGIGRFLAEDGRRLTVAPADGMPMADILVFVTGTALAAILYQRGAMLLHSSAVVHDGHAFLFCGTSGAGKSTLAAALVQAGCGFLADDVCRVEGTGDRRPWVLPDGRALRLNGDSIRRIGLSERVGAKVRQRIDKFQVTVPLGAMGDGQGVPLGAVYMLADANAAFPPGISRLPTLVAAQSLLHHTYRRQLALAYARQGQLGLRSAVLLSHVPVFLLQRPRDFSRLDETVTQLRAQWDGLPTRT